MNAIVKVDFHGDTVTAVREGDRILVVLKPIIERLGLDWNGQYQRISRHEILAPSMCMTHIETPAGPREAVALPLDLLPGFLFGIDTARIASPDVREAAIAYQRECFAVLYQHFFGRKDDAPIDWDTLAEKLNLVKAARLTLGAKEARLLWDHLGLPHGEAEPSPEEAQADGLASYVKDFLDEMTEPDANARVSSVRMHEAYCEWARRSGAPHIIAMVFGRTLSRLGTKRVKSNGYAFYLGQRIKFASAG